MNKNILNVNDLKVENEIHNEQIKLLAISITEKVDDIEAVLKITKQEDTFLGLCANDVRMFADIIIGLAHNEIKKSQC